MDHRRGDAHHFYRRRRRVDLKRKVARVRLEDYPLPPPPEAREPILIPPVQRSGTAMPLSVVLAIGVVVWFILLLLAR